MKAPAKRLSSVLDGSSGPGDGNARLLVATGIGGRIELMEDHIRLIKDSVFGTVVNLLGLGFGKVYKTIMIADISSVSIVRPLVFPDFIRFTYPGSPISSGKVLHDALAENALLMNVVDNRRFYELKDAVDERRRRRNGGASIL